MSQLILLEGFDWCASGDLVLGPWIDGGGIAVGGGRTRNGCGTEAVASLDNSFFGGPPGGWMEWTAGMAVNYSLYFSGQDLIVFEAFLSGTSVRLQHVGDGRLQVGCIAFGSQNTSDPSTAPFILKPGMWWYLEMQASESVTNVPAMDGMGPYWYVTYIYSVRVNGDPSPFMEGAIETVHVSGSIDAGKTAFTQFTVVPSTAGVMDDVYLTDDTFLGNITVWTGFPNGEGNQNDFVPDPTQANYLNVREHNPGPDRDTTYNYATTAGDVDLYTFDQLVPFTPPPMTTGISGVQAMVIFRTSDTGTATVSGTMVSSGTHYFPSAPVPPTETYMGQWGAYLQSPGGGDWTQDEVNDIQIGLTRNS
jgi:hypothetical protein